MGEKSEPGLVAAGTKPRPDWGENRGPTGGFSFPVNTQSTLVFGSGGRKTAGEHKEKGARAGKVQMLVFQPPNLNVSENSACFLH